MTLKELLWGNEVVATVQSDLLLKALSEDGLKLLEPRPIIKQAQRALAEMFDVSIGDILSAAWVTSSKLRKAADPVQHTPNEVVLVPLLEHAIRSKQEPTLDFTIDGRPVLSLKFTVELRLELSGVLLRVRDARIREIAAGKCNATATLSMGEAKLAERTTRDIELPLCVPLGGRCSGSLRPMTLVVRWPPQ